MSDYLFWQRQRQTFQAAWAWGFPGLATPPAVPPEDPPAGSITLFPEKWNAKSRGTWRGGGALPEIAADAPPTIHALPLPHLALQRIQTPLVAWSPDLFGSESLLGRLLFPDTVPQPRRTVHEQSAWSPDVWGSESLLGRALAPDFIVPHRRTVLDQPGWSPDIFGSTPASLAGLFPDATPALRFRDVGYAFQGAVDLLAPPPPEALPAGTLASLPESAIIQRFKDWGFAWPGAVDLLGVLAAEALPPGTLAVFPERFNAKSRGTWRGGGAIPPPPPGPSLEGTIWLWSFPDPAPKRAAQEAYWIRPFYQVPELPVGEPILAAIKWYVLPRTSYDVRGAFGFAPPPSPEIPGAKDTHLIPERAPGFIRTAASAYLLTPFPVELYAGLVPETVRLLLPERTAIRITNGDAYWLASRQPVADFSLALPEEARRIVDLIPRAYARAGATAYFLPSFQVELYAGQVPVGLGYLLPEKAAGVPRGPSTIYLLPGFQVELFGGAVPLGAGFLLPVRAPGPPRAALTEYGLPPWFPDYEPPPPEPPEPGVRRVSQDLRRRRLLRLRQGTG